jgi:hypothetical protein
MAFAGECVCVCVRACTPRIIKQESLCVGDYGMFSHFLKWQSFPEWRVWFILFYNPFQHRHCFYTSMDTIISSSLFWAVMKRRLVVSYQCLGTTCKTHLLKASPLKTGLTRCPQMTATKHKSMLHNTAAGQRSHFHHSGRLYHTQMFFVLNF